MQLDLKTWREKRGWSLDELSRRSGIHKSTISRLERGITEPSLRTAEALERALRVRRGAMRFAYADCLQQPAV